MGFEKKILNVVAEALDRERSASFTNGTLFVSLEDPSERKLVTDALYRVIGNDTDLIVSDLPYDEIAIDFV